MGDISAEQKRARNVRVVVVDHSAFARKVVRGTLHSRPNIEVVGWSAGGRHAVTAVAELRPDVVTVDIGLLRRRELSALELQSVCATSAIVIVTASTRLPVDPSEFFLVGASAVARRPATIDIFDATGTAEAFVEAVLEAALTRAGADTRKRGHA